MSLHQRRSRRRSRPFRHSRVPGQCDPRQPACSATRPGRGSRGAGDISYIAAYVDCIDGLGASGKGAHAPGETINLKELPFLIKRAALTIYRLSR